MIKKNNTIVGDIIEIMIFLIKAIILFLVAIFLITVPHFIQVKKASAANKNIVELNEVTVLKKSEKEFIDGSVKKKSQLTNGEYSSSEINNKKLYKVSDKYTLEDLKYYDTRTKSFMTAKYDVADFLWISLIFIIVYSLILNVLFGRFINTRKNDNRFHH